MGDHLPTEGVVYGGKVRKIESFGAFIEMEGFASHGLVHISQLAKDRVDNVEDVVSVGQAVYVKVLSVDPADHERGRPKIGLSMKYADQSTGADRDRNGIDAEQEQQKRRTFSGSRQEPVTLQAVYNTVCSKCNGKGHLASECFNTGGTTYELIPEDDVEELEQQRSNARSGTKGRRGIDRSHNYSPPPSAAIGRGRGATLPSWMTNDSMGSSLRQDGAEHSRHRSRSRSRSRDRNAKKRKYRSRSRSCDSTDRHDDHRHHKKKKDKDKKKKKDKKHRHKHHKSKNPHKEKKTHKDRKRCDDKSPLEHRDRDYRRRSRSSSLSSDYRGKSYNYDGYSSRS